MTIPAQPLPEILVAEDDPCDWLLVHHQLELAGVRNPVVHLKDGQELIDFLSRISEDPLSGAKRFCLLFLDINMPRVNGFEALVWMRSTRAWKDLPVVALAGAIEASDVKRAAGLGISRFVIKYPRPQVLAEIVAEHCRSC